MPALPEWVDPRALAVTSASVEGEIATHALSRLTPELDSESESRAVSVWLTFAEDSQRRVTITGKIRADLRLQCQRCLGPADWLADIVVQAMVVINDDAAAEVPRAWEPVVVGAHGLSPAGLVEDELLLALPVAAHCNDAACRERYAEQQNRPARADDPFAVLQELKRGR